MGTAYSTLYGELANQLNDTGSTAIWSVARRKVFINRAINHANDMGAFQEILDETLTVVLRQTDYTLPTAITDARQLVGVYVEQNISTTPWREYGRWIVTKTVGALPTSTPTLHLILAQAFGEVAGKKIRLRHKAPYPTLTNDSDVTNLSGEFIYAYAKFLAHDEAAGNASTANRQFHLEEAKRAFDIANSMLSFILAKALPVRTIPAEQ